MPRPPKPKPKSPNGGGSVTHRPDGRYEVRVTLPDGRRLSRYADTPTAASVLLRGLLAGVDNGTLVVSSRQTLAEYLAVWHRDTVTPTVRASTAARYRQIVE